MAGGEPALLLALLGNHEQQVLHIPGRVVNRASDGYRGEGKTDARDALVIADQARIHRDLQAPRPGNEAAIELRLLTNRLADLVRGCVPAASAARTGWRRRSWRPRSGSKPPSPARP
jgi:hypothetical protein